MGKYEEVTYGGSDSATPKQEESRMNKILAGYNYLGGYCTNDFTTSKYYPFDDNNVLTDDAGDKRPYLKPQLFPRSFEAVYTPTSPCQEVPIVGQDPKTVGNPKAPLGMAKPPLHLIPPVAMVHYADAMRDGAEKYGAWNFREVDISASVYQAAAKRHLELWFDREEVASDSGVHHLGHAMACIGMILDSMQCGNLIDDRPPTSNLGQTFTDYVKRRKNES